jgi:integrase
MPRTSKRQTLARGIYLDGNTLELRATANGVTVIERLPGDTDLKEAIRKRAQLLARNRTERPRPKSHTLDTDVPRYLKLQRHLTNYTTLKGMLARWLRLYPGMPRHRITAEHVLAARNVWLDEGAAPKSINDRVAVLRHLYHLLDGKRAPTPCDDVVPLPRPRTPIQRVPDALILRVDAELQRREARATYRLRFDGAKTRARFRVLVSTGRRPSELMRAQKTDVDLEARVWVVRDGKGGWSPGLYLNDDMLAAWTLFIEADAWGKFNHGNYARVIRSAGWPQDVRPYQARHTTWITAVERGADMADVQQAAGHRNIAMTVKHYTGVRASRMQGLSERLDGRFGGFKNVGEEE